MELLVLVIVVVMLCGAIAALLLKDFLAALAAFSVVSLGLSVLFVILRAPDVAMTEAAIGAGLSSLLFALALRRLGLWRIKGQT
ncbi:MAG: hydrogenase subunit MbhD domain-containing protein [Pseudomonadota bacterium]|nr:hydrogenase subunit MbhD domain-containing protein [Pseudomonadota bacterium]